MYSLIENLIGYTGSTNVTSTILYLCCALILLGVVVTIDLLYKFFLRFLPRDSK